MVLFKKTLFTLIALAISSSMCLAGLEITLRLNNVSHITPGFLKTHPERRYELRPNFVGKTYDVPFEVNSNGLRDLERKISKGNDAYRIAIYGDSLVMGVGVKLMDTFPKVLESKINNQTKIPVQVFNFGINGYNTFLEHLYIKDSYEKYKPHMIIVSLAAGGDSVTTISPGSFKNSNQYQIVRKIKDQLRHLHSYHWLSARYHNFIFNWGRSFQLKPMVAQNKNPKNNVFDDPLMFYGDNYPGWIEAQQVYKDLSVFCKEKNITLIFSLYASSTRFSPKYEDDFFYPAIQKVRKALAANNIQHTVFLDDIFRAYYDNQEILWVRPNDSHLSKFAHDLVGQKLFDYITGEKLINFE